MTSKLSSDPAGGRLRYALVAAGPAFGPSPRALPRERPAFAGAWGLAVVAHAALLVLLVPFWRPTPPSPKEAAGLAVIFAAPEQAQATLTPLQSVPLVPDGAPPTAPIHLRAVTFRTSPPARSASSPGVATQPPTRLALRALRSQAGVWGPPPARADARSAPAPAVTVAPQSPAELASLEARIDEAVRAAAIMPAAARRQRREGSAQVRFDYWNGTVEDVRIAASSQSEVLDNAAIQAVRSAHYPPAPPQIGARRLGLRVRIDFRLTPLSG